MSRLRTPHPLLFSVLSAWTLAATLAAQAGTDWSQQLPVHGPSNRFGAALAFDSARGCTVLFGGQQSPNFFKDTWEWAGQDWAQFGGAVPPARSFMAMTFDSDRKVVVLFGGRDRAGAKRDTWEFDGMNWIERFPANSPPPDTGHSMAYDSARHRVVMFSGNAGLAGTWEYDGSNWTQIVTATTPPPRTRHAMAYDAFRQKIVMFGGRTDLADTWEYDGTDWTLRTSANTPPGRSEHAMTYDSVRHRVVINAGIHSSFTPNQLDDTWEWDGTDWYQRLPTTIPPRRDGHQMVFDTRQRVVVMFGHGTDTWQYGPTNPASVEVGGAGCAGSAGTPSLLPGADSLPWIGDTFSVDLGQIAPAAPWSLLIGASNTNWGLVSLPLALGGVGMLGCALATSIDILQTGSGSSFAMPIPVVLGLEGTPFHLQALIVDGAANSAGLVLSNSLDAVIGLK
ncbi:MAG: kelch repeat-containing protein [Planctomycetota bacterium]